MLELYSATQIRGNKDMSPAAKEVNELLDAAILAGQDIKEVFANGKVGLEDLGVLFKINRQLPVFMAAINGLENVWPNVSLVTPEELVALETKVRTLLALIGLKLEF
jgi:hypothetical protein